MLLYTLASDPSFTSTAEPTQAETFCYGRILSWQLPGLLISDLESVFLLHDSGGDRFVRRSAGAVEGDDCGVQSEEIAGYRRLELLPRMFCLPLG